MISGGGGGGGALPTFGPDLPQGSYLEIQLQKDFPALEQSN